MLSVFLRGEEVAQNPSQIGTVPNNQSQSNNSVGSIKSNGNMGESDVSPIMTPSTIESSATPPRTSIFARPVNVWGSIANKDDAKASAGKKFKLDAEEYPDLGQHTKRSKVAPSQGAVSQPKSTSCGTSLNDEGFPRNRRIATPVLGHYMPQSVLPHAETSPNQQQEAEKKMPGAVTSATTPKRKVATAKNKKESSEGLQGHVCHGSDGLEAEDAEIPPSQEDQDDDGFIVVRSRNKRIVRVPPWGAPTQMPQNKPNRSSPQNRQNSQQSYMQERKRKHVQDRQTPQRPQGRPVPRGSPQQSPPKPKLALEPAQQMPQHQQQQPTEQQSNYLEQVTPQPQLSGVQLGQHSTRQPSEEPSEIQLQVQQPQHQVIQTTAEIQLQVQQPQHEVHENSSQVQLEEESREEVQPLPSQHQRKSSDQLRKRSHSSLQQRPSPYDLKQRPLHQHRSHSNGPQQLSVPSPGRSLRATQSEYQLPSTGEDGSHRPVKRDWMYERQNFEAERQWEQPEEEEEDNITRLARFSSLNSNAQEFTPRGHQADEQEEQVAPSRRISQRRLRQRHRRTLRNPGSSEENQIPFYVPQGPNQGVENTHNWIPNSYTLPQSPFNNGPPKTNIYPTPVAPVSLGSVPSVVYQQIPNAPPPTITLGHMANTPSVIYYNPQTQQSWSTNATPAEVHSRCQSGFRLASLPTTGVGTPNSDTSTGWGSLQSNNPSSKAMSAVCRSLSTPPSTITGPEPAITHTLSSTEEGAGPQPSITHTLSSTEERAMSAVRRSLSIPPSTITGPEQSITHTLSSTEEERADQSGWQATNRDLMYSQPLLDMDREDTPSPSRQWPERHGAEEVVEVTAPVPRTVLYQEDGELIELDAEAGGRGRNRNPVVNYTLFRTPADNSGRHHDYPQPDFNCIPSSIRSLYRLVTAKYSSYSFIYVLCAQLCRDCGPIDCYANLKIALLTSIVSIEPGEVRPPIPMCVIATDSLVCRRIMTGMGKLAPRFVATGDQDIQQTAHALPQRSNWKPSNPLIMAQKGVINVGDWNGQSNSNTAYLEKCIENGAVPIPQTQEHQPLNASIWTYWEKSNAANPNVIFSKFCPLFGFPIYMPDNVEESLYIYYLMEACEDRDEEVWDIPGEDISMMLHVFSNRVSVLTPSAEKLLKKYYFVSRRDRPVVFSAKTYEVLKQMSEALAKLSFRVEVVDADVCAAIYHCETFMNKFFASGSTRPPPDVPAGFKNMSEIDPHMNEFSRWLLTYLDRYSDEDLGMMPAQRQTLQTNDWECP
ncbi:putative uncharacterized protein DDB_G0291608 isoform X1 [Drosophila bipectinata]|uniref:putative uncharacterized protein DDB_G0291608 isoform X1 n=1 Tax=Drosophila bipectinata TaxID=42026 RepID=UPI001C8AE8A1|nr:uncharacterized protein LOC108127206 [Drosophila bipectinata]